MRSGSSDVSPSRRVRLAISVVLAALSAGAAPGLHAAQDGARPVFVDAVSAAGRGPRVESPRHLRSRPVVLRADEFLSGAADLELNLFPDVVVTARPERVETRGARSFLWHGRLVGASRGDATFVATDGVFAGTVFADNGVFEIGYLGDGIHEVRELDPTAFPSDDPVHDLEPPAMDEAGDALGGGQAAVVADTAAQIDVMVVWTPAARTSAGGTSAIQSLVDLSVANANTAYANSGVTTRLRLVHKSEVTHTEAAIDTDLSRLSYPGDGYLDTVQTLRTQYGADVVTLIGNYSGACGIGYLMSYVSSSFANSAFNVVERTCAAGNLSYAHEVGHNQGLHHDPANASGQGAYAYAYGYQDPGGAFRTVMSYGGATRVKHLSNPNVSYNGRVTGTSTQNNALALNNTAYTVANFRQAVASGCAYTLSATSYAAVAGGATSSVTVTAPTGCAWTAVSNAAWVTVTGGASGSGNGTVTFSVAANTSTSSRTGTVTIAGQTFTVTQAGLPCTYTLSATSYAAVAGGATSSVTVTAGTGCAWTAVSNAAWVTVTGGASGSGNGTVTFTVAANTSTSARTGTVTIAGQTFTVTQAGVLLTPTLNPVTGGAVTVGGTVSLSGTNFTAGSRIKFFVNTSAGVIDIAPNGYVPSSTTSTSLTWAIPASVPLGSGAGSVQVVNTDQGYTMSNLVAVLIFGDAADNIPTIRTINTMALAAADPNVPAAHIDTVVVPGSTVTIGGTGFNNARVNVYTAAGNVGPLTPLAGSTGTSLLVSIPFGIPVGPGTFEVVNSPYTGNVQSNAVAVVLGAQLSVTAVVVSGNTVTVTGTGFSSLSVINLYNSQGGTVANLGGLGPSGPRIPLTVTGSTMFTFQVPASAVPGAAYVQVLNPPYYAYTSTGNDPDGGFTLP